LELRKLYHCDRNRRWVFPLSIYISERRLKLIIMNLLLMFIWNNVKKKQLSTQIQIREFRNSLAKLFN
jgi:hypothetical protein